MALIDENLHSKAASIDDKRAKVRFLIADPRKEKIGEAIQAMEDLVKGADATPDDYFTLAQLYLKKGDWNNYDNRMHSVLGAQKGAVQPERLIFYINTLLEKKQLDDADNWLQTLEKTAPNHFDTVRLRAEYQFLRGNYKAAGDLAMAFLDNPNAQPAGSRTTTVARGPGHGTIQRSAQGGRQAGRRRRVRREGRHALCFPAEQKVSQAGDILFAAYLARQKRIRECLDVLEQCWDKCPAEDLQIPASLTDSVQGRKLRPVPAIGEDPGRGIGQARTARLLCCRFLPSCTPSNGNTTSRSPTIARFSPRNRGIIRQ